MASTRAAVRLTSVLLLLPLLGCSAAPAAAPTQAHTSATAAPTTAAPPLKLTATAVATPLQTPRPPAPSPAATIAPIGYLEGRVSIGPLSPVERAGVPTPTPSPAICTSRGLRITANGVEVTSFSLDPDCDYRVVLAPGSYTVGLREQQGVGGSKDLPKNVLIEAGKTTRLDLSIDTGIR